MDITFSYHIFGTPSETYKLLKAKIKSETGLNASLGCAPTKMAAKIASEMNKPNGYIEVAQKNIFEFLWPLDIGKVWGLGKKVKAA